MSEVTDEEIKAARKKMEEKFGNLQIGGKGNKIKLNKIIINRNPKKKT
ncbi:MAG: hypothetical protein MJ252_04455 [archaeon]|nr:hypothetical protein [archaeon]